MSVWILLTKHLTHWLSANESYRLHVRKDGKLVYMPYPMVCSLYDRSTQNCINEDMTTR